MSQKPFLTIKISPQVDDGKPLADASIFWKNAPEFQHEWDDVDQAWRKICDGIHSLIANLHPQPETGWEVEFECNGHQQIVDSNQTQEDYYKRHQQGYTFFRKNDGVNVAPDELGRRCATLSFNDLTQKELEDLTEWFLDEFRAQDRDYFKQLEARLRKQQDELSEE